MGKLMLAVGVLASVVLLDPMGTFNLFGPQASWLGWKISKTIESERASVQFSWFRR
ncbi:MAG TPA: hypothetical protein VKE26_16440 [Xanthobacteraceae bacterium]|nr:hypothetical protein [Xanthobacteraceae bacterium]